MLTRIAKFPTAVPAAHDLGAGVAFQYVAQFPDQVVRYARTYRTAEVPGAGHWLIAENPDFVTTELTTFFAPGAGTMSDFWEQHYRNQTTGGHRRPTPILTEVAGQLTPGAALDLGCGTGGDTGWLVRNGWHVTAVDIAATAVERTLVVEP